jgi:hypothetical protein
VQSIWQQADYNDTEGISKMNASFSKAVVPAVIAGVIILASVVWYSLTGPAPRTSNVTPADSDYPIVNPHASHTIEVTLLMPASLNLQLSALYSNCDVEVKYEVAHPVFQMYPFP